MKARIIFLITLLLFSGTSVYAELHNRGSGLIFDDVLNITWLQDANYAQTSGYDTDGDMTWLAAMEWADQLEYGGYKDWRLPTTPGTTSGFIDEGEMGHLYWNEGINSSSPGLFMNVQPDWYWFGTETTSDPLYAWEFAFYEYGLQSVGNKGHESFAWAVRDGDVVPHPILLGWDYPNGLITVNPVTAGYTIILDSNRQFEAMAYDPENKLLYAIENLGGNNLLVSIDFKNELITDIGYVEGYTEITSMAFDRTTNTLYAIDQTTRTLLEINLQTGAGTAITNYSSGTSNALAAHPITGELYLGWGVDPSYLTKIDKTTGDLTTIGSLGINAVTAFDFNPESYVLYGAGQFYGSGYQLFTVDITDGTVNPIGPLGQVTSVAFIDSPISVDITVTTPNGGEYLFAGETYAITWTSEGDIANVKIEYSVDNATGWTEIIASTENDGSYDWEVPCDISTDSLIRISDVDSDASDTSDGVFSIKDDIAPNIDVLVTPDILWPPNHKMVLVTTTVTVTDNCDTEPEIVFVSIVMDESDETITYDPNYDFSVNDGKTSGDIQIVDDYNFYLRCERSGKSDGRTYTITYKAIDESENESTAYVDVLVPHSM